MARFAPAARALPCIGLAAACLLAPGQAAEPAHGVYGVTVAVRAEGVLRPRISSARIVDVRSGLPAARAGVVAGDEVLEVDCTTVRGAAAADLAPLSQGKRVGERIRLLLARPDGATYAVDLVAVPRPSE
jgi:S1-C subfamily serine protease